MPPWQENPGRETCVDAVGKKSQSPGAPESRSTFVAEDEFSFLQASGRTKAHPLSQILSVFPVLLDSGSFLLRLQDRFPPRHISSSLSMRGHSQMACKPAGASPVLDGTSTSSRAAKPFGVSRQNQARPADLCLRLRRRPRPSLLPGEPAGKVRGGGVFLGKQPAQSQRPPPVPTCPGWLAACFAQALLALLTSILEAMAWRRGGLGAGCPGHHPLRLSSFPGCRAVVRRGVLKAIPFPSGRGEAWRSFCPEFSLAGVAGAPELLLCSVPLGPAVKTEPSRPASRAVSQVFSRWPGLAAPLRRGCCSRHHTSRPLPPGANLKELRPGGEAREGAGRCGAATRCRESEASGRGRVRCGLSSPAEDPGGGGAGAGLASGSRGKAGGGARPWRAPPALWPRSSASD